MLLSAGARVGQYEVIDVLGAGGMGEVYRARDTRLDRDVALKVLPPHLIDRPAAYERFEREAKVLAALSHPNILAIHDFGREGELAYAVAELLEGETLRERLKGGRLPHRKAVELGLQIVRGLAAAHERGVVHRDLKPENVFVSSLGQVKVLDFGLARYEARGPDNDTRSPTLERHTEPGTVLGTVGYMSPEQVRGDDAAAASDIFAFGSLLYEMVTGRRAFLRETAPETMTAILREDPPDPSTVVPGLPPALDRIVAHCLEKRAQERFHNAHDLAFALEAVSGASARSGLSTPLLPRQLNRSRMLAGITLVLLVAAAVQLGRSWERSERRTGRAGAEPARFMRLTQQPGEKRSPTLAPDGRSFAYAFREEEGGDLDIYVQRVGGGKPVNLTEGSDGDDEKPAFSPDGQQIAFRSERAGGGLFVMGASGESPRRLTDFGDDPSWSPDGGQVVFSTAGVADPLSRSGDGLLWRVNVATGEKLQLTVEHDAVQPRWSPDGRRIAFWRAAENTAQRDLWTIPADGGPALALTNDPAVDWNPVWSADGRFLYFSSDRGGTMNVWRLAIDPASGQPLAPPEAVTTPSLWSGWLSLSQDGRSLVYLQASHRSEIRVRELDPQSGEGVGEARLARAGSLRLREHALSDDGRWLAFGSHSPQEDLFVQAADGSGFAQLTDDVHRDRGPSWSPDGGTIAFYSNRTGSYQVWTVRPDGSGLTQLSDVPGGCWYPIWSPDGARIVTGRDGGAWLLDATTPLAPASPLPPIEEGVHLVPSSWSADGRFIAGAALGPDAQMGRRPSAIFEVGTSRWLRVPGARGGGEWFGSRLIAPDPAGNSKLLDPFGSDSVPFSAAAGVRELAVSPDRRWLSTLLEHEDADVWLMDLERREPDP